MVTLPPSSWQEWNLHDSWRVRSLLIFPKAQGAAENSRFLNKIEVLLEENKERVQKLPVVCATVTKVIFP